MDYRKRMWILGGLDVCTVAAAVILAYALRFDVHIPPDYVASLLVSILANSLLTVILLRKYKMYRRVLRYASVGELLAIVKSVALAKISIFLLDLIFDVFFPQLHSPLSTELISFFLIIIGIGGTRIFWRIYSNAFLRAKTDRTSKNVLIIGAGNAGTLVAKELLQSPDSGLVPVGFIDDNSKKHNLHILGLPVFGSRQLIKDLVIRHAITHIVIAMPSAPKKEIAAIIEVCKHTNASIKLLPSVSDVVNEKVTIQAIRDVRIEDLLGREAITMDLSEIAGYLQDQVILVTGAGGSIGSELCRQISRFRPKKLLLLGRGENSIHEIEQELVSGRLRKQQIETIIADIRDQGRMWDVFEQHRPSVVFHAAAHKHVPLMEQNPLEAVKNNIFGTKNVAECAHQFGVSKFVMISTDKAVNPTSVMGTTKCIAEMIIQGLDRISQTKFVTVRFGNVLGSRGSVVPIFKKQIKNGGPVTVTHPEMERFFMTIPEAVQLVIQAGAFADGGEIFILDMGQPIRIDKLARDLIRLSGLVLDEDIHIQYTGMRPGEKLFEELFTMEEGLTATKHDRIFISNSLAFSWNGLMQSLFELELIAFRKGSIRQEEIIAQLKKIVPTYVVIQPSPPIYQNAEIAAIDSVKPSEKMRVAISGAQPMGLTK
ncbi:polysaccharide biosynthesis protein [Brevibacillus fluminis]|uniref:polysaccharide biosynthesis protein n=1 Tax=Brevibacillus fluminis TaxID=511487 RepID=UPI003F8B1689